LVKTESTKSSRKESSNQSKQDDKIHQTAPKRNALIEKRDDDQDLYASILEHMQRESASSTNQSIASRRSSSKPPLSPKLVRPPRPEVRENARLPPLRSKLQIQPKSSTRAGSVSGVKMTGTRPMSSSSSSRMDQTIQGKRYISQAHLYPENLSFGDEYTDFDDWFSLGSMNPY
jgi:hypothetical protein